MPTRRLKSKRPRRRAMADLSPAAHWQDEMNISEQIAIELSPPAAVKRQKISTVRPVSPVAAGLSTAERVDTIPAASGGQR